MAIPKSGIRIPRQSILGSEGLYAKMFDPPADSPPTPDCIDLTAVAPGPWPPPAGSGPRANPVPAVMQAAGLMAPSSSPHALDLTLLNGLSVPTWDGLKNIEFMTFAHDRLLGTDASGTNFSAGRYPAPTVRVPRGAIFHGFTQAKGPPPHTIHWHGIEPTPMNDGVGHCSFEIQGSGYTYQWQPNFIGTYFYHCHRNTVQHFEFGLFGLMLFDPPDAYYASIASTNPDGSVVLNSIPIGHGVDGLRRTAARLDAYPQFPGYVGGNLAAPDFGMNFANPHAFTVPYDVEVLWVPDDRDSVWSDMAPDAFQTYPAHGTIPGVNDDFRGNQKGKFKFFAFNDFNPDYWFVTGVPVPGPKGGVGTIPAGVVVPPQLNGGISGAQVSVQAAVGQTILLRCLDAAYDRLRVTLPVDALLIEWDGRALGVPPFGLYNEPMFLPAGTPIQTSVARRFGALIRPTAPNATPAKLEFLSARGGQVVHTALIPFDIV